MINSTNINYIGKLVRCLIPYDGIAAGAKGTVTENGLQPGTLVVAWRGQGNRIGNKVVPKTHLGN